MKTSQASHKLEKAVKPAKHFFQYKTSLNISGSSLLSKKEFSKWDSSKSEDSDEIAAKRFDHLTATRLFGEDAWRLDLPRHPEAQFAFQVSHNIMYVDNLVDTGLAVAMCLSPYHSRRDLYHK